MAGDSQVFSAVYVGPEPFLCLAGHGRSGPDAGCLRSLARGARPRRHSRDRPEPEGNQRVLGPLTPLGGGAYVRLDVALQASGKGPRADAGKLGCLGAACGLPLPGAAGCAGITP